MSDPYRILGVLPSADGDVIRAAYRALMKRYHPDQNSSDEAAGRARDVAAAYALLSDPGRRAEFDRQRLAVEPRVLAADLPRRAPVRGRAGGLLLVVLSAGLIAFAVTRPPTEVARSHPQPANPEPSATALASAVRPDLSPGTSRRTSEPPVVTAQQPTPPAPQIVALPLPPATPPVRPAALPTRPQERPPGSRSSSSQNPCDVDDKCDAIDLPALERHVELLTGQSLQNADPETRSLLMRSQTAFLSRMARCTSATCKRDAYLARNREIADIMRG